MLFQNDAKREVVRLRGVVPAFCLVIGFFAFLTGFAVADVVPFSVVVFYSVMSAISFVMYGLDKSAAKRGTWRTAESTLHLTAFVGGWPGALIAQRVLRHKAKKKLFQAILWAGAVVNCAALVWLL